MLEVVYLWMNRHAFKRGIKELDRLGGGHRAHPGGTTFFTENLGGTAGPGGTSDLTGYAEAVGLDSSTVDVMNNVISSLQPANEFI